MEENPAAVFRARRQRAIFSLVVCFIAALSYMIEPFIRPRPAELLESLLLGSFFVTCGLVGWAISTYKCPVCGKRPMYAKIKIDLNPTKCPSCGTNFRQ